MGKRKDKIGEKYEAYKVKFAGKNEADILKDVANLDKEIKGKETALSKIKTKEGKERLEKDLKDLKQEYENLLGYVKHKDEIERIKEIKDKINSKLENKKEIQRNLKQELDQYIKDNIGRYKESKKNIEKAKEGLGEVDNNTLYESEEFKKEFEKTVKNYTTKMKKLEEEMKALPIAMDKCDLAWRSLFANKTWDEINLRAVKMNYKGEKITALKEASKNVAPAIKETAKEVKEEKTTETEKGNVKTNTANVEPTRIEYSENSLTAEEEREAEEAETALTDTRNESFLKKIGKFFKNGFDKVVDWFYKKEVITEEPIISEDTIQTPTEDVVEEVVEEIEEEVKEPVRDAFIQQLQAQVNHEKAKERNDKGTYNKPPRQEEK